MPIPVHSIEIELLLLVFLLGLASYRFARIIIQDEVFAPLREMIWRRFPTNTRVGFFFTCYSCVGFWTSLAFLAAFVLWPIPTLVISVVLAISAIVVIIDDFSKR